MEFINHELSPPLHDRCPKPRVAAKLKMINRCLEAASNVSNVIQTVRGDNVGRRFSDDDTELKLTYPSNGTHVRRDVLLVLYV